MDALELRDLLRRSMLSRDDKQIALSRIAFRAALADIGAAMHMDRSGVSYRLQKIILPELARIMRLDEQNKTGA